MADLDHISFKIPDKNAVFKFGFSCLSVVHLVVNRIQCLEFWASITFKHGTICNIYCIH